MSAGLRAPKILMPPPARASDIGCTRSADTWKRRVTQWCVGEPAGWGPPNVTGPAGRASACRGLPPVANSPMCDDVIAYPYAPKRKPDNNGWGGGRDRWNRARCGQRDRRWCSPPVEGRVGAVTRGVPAFSPGVMLPAHCCICCSVYQTLNGILCPRPRRVVCPRSTAITAPGFVQGGCCCRPLARVTEAVAPCVSPCLWCRAWSRGLTTCRTRYLWGPPTSRTWRHGGLRCRGLCACPTPHSHRTFIIQRFSCSDNFILYSHHHLQAQQNPPGLRRGRRMRHPSGPPPRWRQGRVGTPPPEQIRRVSAGGCSTTRDII